MKPPPRAAGCVVFRRTPQGVRYLVLRAFKNWDFPKELGRPEHHEYRWASHDEAEALLSPRLAIVLEWAQRTIAGG